MFIIAQKILSIFENFDDRKILFWNFPRESPCQSWVRKCHFWTKNSKNFDHFCKKTRESAFLLMEKSENSNFWLRLFPGLFLKIFKFWKFQQGGTHENFVIFEIFLFFLPNLFSSSKKFFYFFEKFCRFLKIFSFFLGDLP